MAPPSQPPLSSILPPLIFGTATFNTQYNTDPYTLSIASLIARALSLGVRAFDTSPYYGPAEALLGAALNTPTVQQSFPRESYFILTKVGRIAGDEFDYSAEWVRKSVSRSLKRLRTEYLDVVYCHDVEFVSAEEVLTAVKELRRIRGERKSIRYIGISGYPLEVLCSLSERILRETGEPIDIVQSYANYTVQNTRLAREEIMSRFRAAKVQVVTNASLLGMGLLRHDGLPQGGMGDWHPAPPPLREAVRCASNFSDQHGERLEVLAIRFGLESWLTAGETVGSHGDPASGVPWIPESNLQVGGKKLGVSVMGVSTVEELEKTMQVWRSILDGLEGGKELAVRAGRWEKDHEWSINRKKGVLLLVEGIWEQLGKWRDYEWASPGEGWVNMRARRKEDKGLLAQREEQEIELMEKAERCIGEQKIRFD